MAPCARPEGERGFTLVEVLVAILVLLVGVLGVVSMVEGANAVTSKTKAREGGTNVARSIIEVSRSIRYSDLTATELLDALSSRPGLADVKPGVTGHQIKSRNVEYETTLTVCSLDDPQDGLGSHTGPVAYCADSDVPAVGVNTDRNPDDYKRVRVTLTGAHARSRIRSLRPRRSSTRSAASARRSRRSCRPMWPTSIRSR